MWLFVCFFYLLLVYVCRYQTPCCCLVLVVGLGDYLGICLWVDRSRVWGVVELYLVFLWVDPCICTHHRFCLLCE